MSSKVERQHESKQREDTVRGGKDDMKEQAYQAKQQVKSKGADLKEQVVQSETAQQGLDLAKEKVGLGKDASNDELVEEVQGQVGQQWEQVKSRGTKQLKKAADVLDAKLDQNLTKDQKAKLQKGVQQAKKGAAQGVVQAQGLSNRLLDMTMSAPILRPARNWIRKNNLALPVVLLLGILTLWSSISLIRLLNNALVPSVPEFDIHSKDAMMDWTRYHAGDLKGQALDARHSLTARAAAFLANNDYDSMKAKAIDYKDLGMSKLGLREPTWGEWAWAKITGRPITWQERVDSVMTLAKAGIAARAKAGVVSGIKNSLHEGVDSIRSHLPGGVSSEELKQRAYEATHQSTLDRVKSGAEYVKNRVLHGSQEAAHIAQDRANELADKAKYKAGL